MSRADGIAVKLVVAVAVILVAGSGFYLLSRIEVDRLAGLDDYTVVISKRRYESFLMRAPGDGGSAPGFIEIFDRNGASCGRVPVPTVECRYDIRWTSSEAEIPAVAEWNFKSHTCYYWSENQDRQIWVRR